MVNVNLTSKPETVQKDIKSGASMHLLAYKVSQAQRR